MTPPAQLTIGLSLRLDPADGRVLVASRATPIEGRSWELSVFLGPGLGRVHGYEVLALVLPYVAQAVAVHVDGTDERGWRGLAHALHAGLAADVTCPDPCGGVTTWTEDG